jgi:hypothetical protein
MITMVNLSPLLGRDMEEDVTRKQRLFKYDCFPALFMRGFVGRQSDRDRFSLAVPSEFLFASWLGVGHEPEQITHALILVVHGQESIPGTRLLMAVI